MQQSSLTSSFRNADLAPSSLNVAIIYEDVEAGKQARKVYDYLVQTLSSETQFSSTMWKFDVLGIPKIREIAARDAAMADIAIVASHGGTELPIHVQIWADQWLALRGNSSALVALFDCSKQQAEGVRASLERIAQLGRMDFFCQLDEWQGGRLNRTQAELPLISTFDTLGGAMRSAVSVPRWGINE